MTKYRVRSVREIQKAIVGLNNYYKWIGAQSAQESYATKKQLDFANWVLVPVKKRKRK